LLCVEVFDETNIFGTSGSEATLTTMERMNGEIKDREKTRNKRLTLIHKCKLSERQLTWKSIILWVNRTLGTNDKYLIGKLVNCVHHKRNEEKRKYLVENKA